MPQSEVDRFDREVGRLIREAAAAERDEIARIVAELAQVQAALRAVVIDGSQLAVQVAQVEKRLAALESTLGRLLVDMVPSAVARGTALIDAGLVAAAVPASTPLIVEVGAGPATTLQSVARQQVSELHTKIIYQLTRLTGPEPVGPDVVLKAFGTRLQGSVVFGGPATRTVGAVRAVLGDVTGQATQVRAAQVADAGGPVTLKRWVHATGVKEPRSSHLAVASRYSGGIRWSQQFEVGSYRTMRPRGPGLPGPHRFGCRCMVAPVLAMEE